MIIDARTHVRVARPSRDLAAAERFYVDGLGLEVQWRTTERVSGKHDLLMVGPEGGGWHFELTRDPSTPWSLPRPPRTCSWSIWGRPSRRRRWSGCSPCGGTRVAAHNPYWDEYGVTVEDPDGYQLVLCSRTWGA